MGESNRMGARQLSTVLATVKANARATELYGIAMEGTGSTMKAQEEWATSLDAKLQALSTSTSVFWQTFVSSDAYGNSIVMLTELINGVTALTERFGAMPVAITILGTAIGSLNKNVGKFATTIGLSVLSLTGYDAKAKATAMGVTLLDGAQIKANISAMALQATLSFGLSVAISGVVWMLSSMVGSLENASEKIDSVKASFDNITDTEKNIKSADSLISKYDQLSMSLKNIEPDTNEYKESVAELKDVKEKLIELFPTSITGYTDEGDAILTSAENLKKLNEQEKENLAIKKELAKNDAIANYDSTKADMEKAQSDYEFHKNQADNYRKAIENGTDLNGNIANEKKINDMKEALNWQTEKMQENYDKLQPLKDLVAQYEEILGLTTQTIKESTEEMSEFDDKVSEVIPKLSELNSLLNDELTEEQNFVSLGKELENIKSLLDDINKNGLTYDTMDKVLSTYEDFSGTITDVSDVQDFLNKKIEDMGKAQDIVYAKMMINDENYWKSAEFHSNEYFENNVRNTSEWEQFQIAVNKNLTSLNSSMLNIMGKNYEKYFGEVADGYSIDLSNVENLNKAKVKIEAEALDKIAKMRQALADASMEHGEKGRENGEYHLTENSADYFKAISEITKWKNDALASIGAIANITKPSFSSLNGSGSNSSSSATEKQIEDLKLLADAYYEVNDAIADLDNAIKKNQLLQKNATPTEKIKLMEEELYLLKEQAKAYKELEKTQREQAKIMQDVLKGQGFNFDEDGDITNYRENIESLQRWANGLSGSAKEEAIDFVKDLMDTLEDYTKLVNQDLPKTEQTYLEYINTIKEAERERAEYVTDLQNKVSDAIKQQLEKETEIRKKELQKQKDLLNDQWKDDDYQDKLTAEQRKLDEIQQQINNLSRDSSIAGQLKLQQLMAEYEAQKQAIDQMIKDQERDNANDRFDEALQEADDKLEEMLDPENLAQLVNQALTSGFVELDGQIYETENLLSQMLENSGEAFTALGSILRSELIEQLETVQGLMGSIGSLQLSSYDVFGNSTNQRNLQSRTAQPMSVVFDAPLMEVNGSITEDVLPRVQAMISSVKDSIVYDISRALQTT